MSLRETLETRKTILLKEPLVKKLRAQSENMEYYELRLEFRRITRRADGEFVEAKELEFGEPILAESDEYNELIRYIAGIRNLMKEMKKKPKGGSAVVYW